MSHVSFRARQRIPLCIPAGGFAVFGRQGWDELVSQRAQPDIRAPTTDAWSALSMRLHIRSALTGGPNVYPPH